MASSRSTNTMAEFLQRIMGDIAEAKTLPDADLEFLIGLETTILQKLRAPVDALMGQMEGGGAGQSQTALPQSPMMPPMPGGGPPMQMPMPQMPTPERVTGTRMEPNMPPIDEIRRTLGGAR